VVHATQEEEEEEHKLLTIICFSEVAIALKMLN